MAEIGPRRDHRWLVFGLACWLVALAVMAVGVGIGALSVTSCADDSSCADDDFFGIVAGAVGISTLLLWPGVAGLVRWYSARRVTAGWRGVVATVLLMAYAQAAIRLYFGGWFDADLLGVLMGVVLLAAWFLLGFWLVSRIVRVRDPEPA